MASAPTLPLVSVDEYSNTRLPALLHRLLQSGGLRHLITAAALAVLYQKATRT